MMSGGGGLLGYPSTWRKIWSPSNLAKQPISQSACAPLMWCFIQQLRIPLKGVKRTRKTLDSTQDIPSFEWWWSRTHTTQLERREEEEGEANLSIFGGCELICFKSVTGGSNMLGFAPNLVSSFYT